ncbi:hypothetical protein THAOC_15016 [Thalassiosira oceanica]|uniref:Uncharacterized protein n=1 Tax=Thalassiosira oceanica TaxID=159749 RepID=K0SG14_THAOC|nr:hypothetical protein THAOC_15016 [Thalassiosira oceanica]|eukprot:EJK64265.1 hypothetical protein THAOC_15016 [Thalassiosira oceanica]
MRFSNLARLVFQRTTFTIPEDSKLTTIRDLEMNQEMVAIDKVLMLKVLYMTRSSNSESRLVVHSRGQYKNKSLSFDRIVFVADSSGDTAAILIGHGSNIQFFSDNVLLRDNGVFCPGALFCIECPYPVESWMGGQNDNNNSGIPLITTDNPVYFVDEKKSPGISLALNPVEESSSRMKSFTIIGSMQVLSINLVPTNCCGRTSCPCFKLNNRTSGVTAKVSLKVTVTHPPPADPENASFIVTNLTSNALTDCLITGIPPGMNAVTLNKLPVVRRLFRRNGVQYFSTVNNNGGFLMTGWVRRGTMVDQGMVESADTGTYRNNPPPVMIASSSLNHHITTMKPANESLPLIAQAQLENLMIDVSSAGAHDEGVGAGVGAGNNENVAWRLEPPRPPA